MSGALGDIGYAIATELAASGVDLALSDVVAEDVGRLAVLRDFGVAASYRRLDTTDAEVLERWLDALEVPTLVVPAAAVVTSAGILDVSPEDWRRELDVDLTGPYLLATAAARRMVAAGTEGSIVFVGSWAADRPHPGIAGYSVAKAGQRMLMRCLALDLADRGIRVNEVAPGFVDAGLSRRIFEQEPGRRQAATAEVPLGRLASAQDVARMVGFLCSPVAAHITGSTLLVDGGLSLCR